MKGKEGNRKDRGNMNREELQREKLKGKMGWMPMVFRESWRRVEVIG